MKKLFLPSLNKAINSYLNLDPESKMRVKKLSGKAIAIELLPFHFRFQCVFSEDNVEVFSDESIETETQIRGTPLQMMGVMINKDNRQQFFAEDITITGNAELGQQVIALFDELQIDWEEHMAQFVGDVPAYHVSRLMKKMGGWLRHSENSFSQDVNEYIHEEAGLFPSNEAFQDFFNDIDALRMDVDRAEIKIKKMKENLGSV